MLTPEQVAEIWGGVRALVKPHYRVGDSFMWEREGQEDKAPEFWPGYRQAYREMERLEPHIIHGEFPEMLFKHRAPNAGPDELAYMRANFKQVTLPVYADAENTVLRPLDDANVKVIYGEQHSPGLRRNCRHQLRMGVTKRRHCNAGQGIQILLAFGIGNPASLSVTERHRQPGIGIHVMRHEHNPKKRKRRPSPPEPSPPETPKQPERVAEG